MEVAFWFTYLFNLLVLIHLIGIVCYVLILMRALHHHMEEQNLQARDASEQRKSNRRLMEALRTKRQAAFTDVIGLNSDMSCVICLADFCE